jgi:hypothetical protein
MTDPVVRRTALLLEGNDITEYVNCDTCQSLLILQQERHLLPQLWKGTHQFGASLLLQSESTEDTISEIVSAGQITKEQIEKAQARKNIQADKKHKDINFSVGQKVLLTSENIAMPNIL